MKESCENCRFYLYSSCHRHTPKANLLTGEGEWPIVAKSQWCGEYQARPETKTMPQITDDVHKIAEKL